MNAKEYGYGIDADLWGSVPDVEGSMDRLLEVLEDLSVAGPVVSGNAEGMGIRFSLVYSDAQRLEDVGREGASVITKAVEQVDLAHLSIEHLSTETDAYLERELATPNFPELVGLSEIAEILGVSKQRVGQLKERPDFPKPIAVLASGPVWSRPMLDRFIDEWPRQGGRAPAWWVAQHRKLIDADSLPAEQLTKRLQTLRERLRAYFPRANAHGGPDHFVIAVLERAYDEKAARDEWFEMVDPLIDEYGIGWGVSTFVDDHGFEIRRASEGAPAEIDSEARNPAPAK